MRNRLMMIAALGAFVIALSASVLGENDTATQTFEVNVDEIAVIDVSGNPGTLTITAPTNGGDDPVEPAADSSTYVWYTSVIPAMETRTIDAVITDGTLPPGTKLNLTAATPTGTGNCGTAVALGVDLSGTAGDIITDIGSCATGQGTGGAQLTYTLTITDIGSLVVTSANSITVTLTLTESSGV